MSLGLSEDEFWRKTPRQTARIFKGKAAQLRREHNERAWLAWHTAVIPRQKKIPELKKLLAPDPKARRQQTPDQQWAVFQAMAEASKVLRKN
ncbi:hypothetical protein [Tardiphaga sp. 862_B3_N1_1]|uniref:hypothetical protein n=1 Tax=Tardiphaga sp. 862_B3_N1_1 TaxID=3240763 RepID=UPI003F8A74BB